MYECVYVSVVKCTLYLSGWIGPLCSSPRAFHRPATCCDGALLIRLQKEDLAPGGRRQRGEIVHDSAAWDGACFSNRGPAQIRAVLVKKTKFHREESTSHHFISHRQVESYVCQIPRSISLSGLVSLGLACLCLYFICSLVDSTVFCFKQVVVAAAGKCYFPHLPPPLSSHRGSFLDSLILPKGQDFAAT